jgi:hypothetical protein
LILDAEDKAPNDIVPIAKSEQSPISSNQLFESQSSTSTNKNKKTILDKNRSSASRRAQNNAIASKRQKPRFDSQATIINPDTHYLPVPPSTMPNINEKEFSIYSYDVIVLDQKKVDNGNDNVQSIIDDHGDVVDTYSPVAGPSVEDKKTRDALLMPPPSFLPGYIRKRIQDKQAEKKEEATVQVSSTKNNSSNKSTTPTQKPPEDEERDTEENKKPLPFVPNLYRSNTALDDDAFFQQSDDEEDDNTKVTISNTNTSN